QRLEGPLDRHVLARRPALQAGALDLLALGDDVVDQVGVAVAEERADGVQARVGERLEEGDVVVGSAHPPVSLSAAAGAVAPDAPPVTASIACAAASITLEAAGAVSRPPCSTPVAASRALPVTSGTGGSAGAAGRPLWLVGSAPAPLSPLPWPPSPFLPSSPPPRPGGSWRG